METPNLRTRFIEELKKAQTEYYTANLDDEEWFETCVGTVHDVIEELYGYVLDVAALQKILSFYLIKSTDVEDKKKEVASRMEILTRVLTRVNSSRGELSVFNGLLFDLLEGDEEM